ncbi:MAG: amidohydrolase [Clostridiales bacterium]|nr:amidohydrolase [Clostridiales bacterium]
MIFKNISLLDDRFHVQENKYVQVQDGIIRSISDSMPDTDDKDGYDGSGKLLMSGFVNSHAHTPMTLLRGYGENLNLSDWLNTRIFPFEAKLTGKDVYYAMLLGIAESLRFGIVSTTDMYFFGEDMVRAILDSEVKNNLSLGITCFGNEDLYDLKNYKEGKALFETYHNAGDGKLKIDMCIHGEYTSTPKVVQQMAGFCKNIGANMHIHLSETIEEHEGCKERNGKTPAQYFNDLGIFDNKTTAAHCVWLEENDFDILADKGVTVASCPVSNLKLASGVCNVPLLMKKGVNVAIGTDSVSSNNSLNMIEEIKFFALVHKEKWNDPCVVTPCEALYAATAAGAKSQGREDTGVLETGMKADLTVLDISGPHMKPVHNLLNNLVYSASGSDVVLTMADGKVLYRDGEYFTIDIEKVIYEVEKSKNRILSELE